MADHWWEKNNIRLIQNNLRAIDAQMNFDDLLARLEEFSANTWLMNTGGIASFYPTELEYHYSNPHLDHDLLEEAVSKCHDSDIRLISRFDFSKIHESIYEEKPEWAYRTAGGEIVNYNGCVHTCVNNGYQREYSMKILEEVISNYDIDGIFFNMFGYKEHDYSGNYYGPCHCENCQRRFEEEFDAELPPPQYDRSYPHYDEYLEFRERTTDELIDSVHELAKGLDEEIAIYTYTDYQVDIVSNESNTAVDRPRPRWQYYTSDNVKTVEDSYSDRIISNICINAVDIPYRYMGVSENEIKIRLYESIASGSGLAFCINGIFENYPDHTHSSAVREVYEFHEANEEYYGNFSSLATLGVLKPGGFRNSPEFDETLEYRGIFKMLKENHDVFDVITERSILDGQMSLADYDVLLVPDMRDADEATLDSVARAREGGTNLVATGRSLVENDPSHLSDLFSASIEKTIENTRGSYVDAGDHRIFDRSPDTDWIFVDGPFSCMEFEEGTDELLPYITPGSYGPPERVSHTGNQRSDYSGAGVDSSGVGTSIYIPWQVGKLYYEHGYEPHKNALLDLVEHATDHSTPLTTNAPSELEVFFDRVDDDKYMVQFLNLSGFNGTSYFSPTPIENVTATLDGITATDAFSLREDRAVPFEEDAGRTTITINQVSEFESVVVDVS